MSNDEKRDPLFRRKHKGLSDDGGRFASKEQDEPTNANLSDVLSPEQSRKMMDLSLTVARRRFRGLNGYSKEDIEDVAAASMLSFLRAVQNRPALMNENPEGYLTTTVAHAFTAATNPVSKSARGGMAELARQSAEIEQNIGRSLTTAERNALAEKIRDEWADDRTRPPEGFHTLRYRNEMIATDFSERGSENLNPMFGGSYGNPEDIAINPDYGMWQGLLLSASEKSAASESIFRYNAFAEQEGLPLVEPASITHRQRVKAVENLKKGAAAANNLPLKAVITAEMRRDEFVRRLKDYATTNNQDHADDLFRAWDTATGKYEGRTYWTDEHGTTLVDENGKDKLRSGGTAITKPMPDSERKKIARALLQRPPAEAYEFWMSALKMADSDNKVRLEDAVKFLVRPSKSGK